MKKFLAILLIGLYITTTSGVVLSIHYCMGEVSGVAIGHTQSNNCATCGMDNQGCCHDDFKVVKVSDNHQAPLMADDLQKFFVPAPEPVTHHFSYLPLRSGSYHYQAHAPPSPGSLNILYCVFRI